jgi:hypothetical protein
VCICVCVPARLCTYCNLLFMLYSVDVTSDTCETLLYSPFVVVFEKKNILEQRLGFFCYYDCKHKIIFFLKYITFI